MSEKNGSAFAYDANTSPVLPSGRPYILVVPPTANWASPDRELLLGKLERMDTKPKVVIDDGMSEIPPEVTNVLVILPRDEWKRSQKLTAAARDRNIPRTMANIDALPERLVHEIETNK